MPRQVLDPSSNEPSVFKEQGNRRQGYKCGPCMQYKKGCTGNSPVCDTCKRYRRMHLCTFDPAAIRSVKQLIATKSQSSSRSQESSPPSRNPKKSKTPNKTRGHAERRQTTPEVVSMEEPIRSEAESTSTVTYSPTRSTESPVISSISILTREEYEARIAPYLDLMNPNRNQTHQQRQLQQRRRVDALFSQEVEQITDPVVKTIVQKYGRPVSRNLLPIIEEITAEIRKIGTIEDEKAILSTVKMRLDMVWDFFLTYYDDPLGLAELYSQNMTRAQRIAWLRAQSAKPVTEHEVEEFWFAYICVSHNGWDQEDPEMNMARWCYVRYIDTEIEYLRRCLKWHEDVQLPYSSRSGWLREWLQEKIDADEELVVVTPGEEVGKSVDDEAMEGSEIDNGA